VDHAAEALGRLDGVTEVRQRGAEVVGDDRGVAKGDGALEAIRRVGPRALLRKLDALGEQGAGRGCVRRVLRVDGPRQAGRQAQDQECDGSSHLGPVEGTLYALMPASSQPPRGASSGRYRLRMGDRVVTIPPPGIVVGRGEGCDLVLDESAAPRKHARFEVAADGRLVVEDLGSDSSHLLNGAPAPKRSALAHGDRVTIGRSVLVVLDSKERSQTTRQASPGSFDLETEVVRLEEALRRNDMALAAERGASAVAAMRGRMIDPALRTRLEQGLVQLGAADRVWLGSVLELCASEKAVPLSGTVARMHELARVGRGPAHAVLRQYLATMTPVATALPTSDQIQLRRVEALLRASTDG
jgi:hypothetical protein